jgi:hypothetical protein
MKRFRLLTLLSFGTILTSQSLALASARVDLVIAGKDPDEPAVEAVVRERLSELELEVRTTHAEVFDAEEAIRSRPDPTSLAHVWIDLTPADQVSIFVSDGPSESMLVRRLPRAGASDEMLRETVGHVVASAADALSHGAVIGISRSSLLEEVAPPRQLSTPPKPGARFEPGVFYEVERYGPGELAQGPAIELAADVRVGRGTYGAWVSAQFRLPMEVAGPVSLDLGAAGAFRAMGFAALTLTRSLTIRPAAGLGVDLFRYSPRAGSALGGAPSPAADVAEPIASLATVLVWSHPALSVFAGPTVDAGLAPRRYIVEIGGIPQVLFQPGVLRPGLVVGLSR